MLFFLMERKNQKVGPPGGKGKKYFPTVLRIAFSWGREEGGKDSVLVRPCEKG